MSKKLAFLRPAGSGRQGRHETHSVRYCMCRLGAGSDSYLGPGVGHAGTDKASMEPRPSRGGTLGSTNEVDMGVCVAGGGVVVRDCRSEVT